MKPDFRQQLSGCRLHDVDDAKLGNDSKFIKWYHTVVNHAVLDKHSATYRQPNSINRGP